MDIKERVVRLFIAAYNEQDVTGCANYMAEDIELWSTYAQQLFPESEGKVLGKKQVLDYLEWLFSKVDGLEAHEYELDYNGDYFVVQGDSNNQELNYYMHYYVNDDNLLFLIKSNLTQPMP